MCNHLRLDMLEAGTAHCFHHVVLRGNRVDDLADAFATHEMDCRHSYHTILQACIWQNHPAFGSYDSGMLYNDKLFTIWLSCATNHRRICNSRHNDDMADCFR